MEIDLLIHWDLRFENRDLIRIFMLTVKSIKEFLKPDLRKIILALVAYLLTVYFLMQNMVCLAMVDAPCLNLSMLKKVVSGSANFSMNFSVLMEVIVLLLILLLILPFLIFYLVSCFVIFTWNKIKNKKQ